jgi:hypothetical protein
MCRPETMCPSRPYAFLKPCGTLLPVESKALSTACQKLLPVAANPHEVTHHCRRTFFLWMLSIPMDSHADHSLGASSGIGMEGSSFNTCKAIDPCQHVPQPNCRSIRGESKAAS